MPGCRGTSALPADNGKCFLPFEGDVDVFLELRYRPILAVTYKGTYGAPVSGLFINGGPGTGYQGAGTSFSCDVTKSPQDGRCAAHLSAGQPVQILTSSTVRATLVAVSPPCGGTACEFVLNEDTCIEYEFENGDPGLFPTVDLTPITCPTGPGVSGPGGGGGGGAAADRRSRARSPTR